MRRGWFIGVLLALLPVVGWTAAEQLPPGRSQGSCSPPRGAGAVPGDRGSTDKQLSPGLVNPGHHDKPAWFKASFLDLPEDLREAAAQGKRLMLFFYQDGCPYCKVMLTRDLRQPEVADATRRRFDVVAINLWGDLELIDPAGRKTTEKQYGRDIRVQFTPTIVVLDDNGAVAQRLNGYYSPHKYLAAIGAGIGTEPPSGTTAIGRLHSEPGALAPPYRFADALARTGKPLLVMFEHPGCAACDELHRDILAREASRALLARFEVAIVDARWSAMVQTPDGGQAALADWARALGIHYAPTLVFFERGGREVFRAEAEFKAFHVQSMLDYVASGAYRTEPQFQRYVQRRADEMRAKGLPVELMK